MTNTWERVHRIPYTAMSTEMNQQYTYVLIEQLGTFARSNSSAIHSQWNNKWSIVNNVKLPANSNWTDMGMNHTECHLGLYRTVAVRTSCWTVNRAVDCWRPFTGAVYHNSSRHTHCLHCDVSISDGRAYTLKRFTGNTSHQSVWYFHPLWR